MMFRRLILVVVVVTTSSATAAQAITITGTTIDGPTDLPANGDHKPYTITITGTGTGTAYYSVCDNDDCCWPDDTMIDEKSFTIPVGTVEPWTKEIEVELWCGTLFPRNKEVRAGDGSSDEGDTAGDPAEVYALIENYRGKDLKVSNVMNVWCVPHVEATAGPPNPEYGDCYEGCDIPECDCDTDWDDIDCDCFSDCEGQCVPIPTLSEWGLIVMTLLVLTAGTVVFGRRRPAVA